MKRLKRLSKTVTIMSLVLDIMSEIVLLPVHICKTVLNIIAEINK